MENDTQLMEIEPHEIKMEACPDAREYRLVDGRLVASSDCEPGDEELTNDENGCIMPQFDTETELAMIPGLNSQTDVLHSVYSENSPELNHGSDAGEDSADANDIVIQLMDIRTSLSTLRVMLEQRLEIDLTGYEFWLQNSKMLESHKTLVDQCIKGEGVVQVNVQIKPDCQRINIMDVLKPDEEYLDINDEAVPQPEEEEEVTNGDTMEELEPPEPNVEQDNESVRISDEGNNSRSNSPQNNSVMVKWTVDLQFKSDQLRLHIPEDPNFWTVPQVRHWIQWAVRQFNLTGIKLFDWSISGNELCALTLQEFKNKCPSDPGDLFWTHLELLRKCKFIAVVQNENNVPDIVPDNTSPSAIRKKPKASPILMDKSSPTVSLMSAGIHRAGNNGQIQLWQFLLELLTSTEHKAIIQWIGANGEFKLQDPELVAKLWGLRKHKPTMNYEKLSRALRYYYDGDMIAKVPGKRFVYSFVCDLKQLIGYNAAELSILVNEGLSKPTAEESNTYEMYW